jgi:hypothetical protein
MYTCSFCEHISFKRSGSNAVSTMVSFLSAIICLLAPMMWAAGSAEVIRGKDGAQPNQKIELRFMAWDDTTGMALWNAPSARLCRGIPT